MDTIKHNKPPLVQLPDDGVKRKSVTSASNGGKRNTQIVIDIDFDILPGTLQILIAKNFMLDNHTCLSHM